jgi:hypothetical protein
MARSADAATAERCDDATVAQTLSELGYELALRGLDHQESTLDDLRTRTGTLLTATALVATFLGARALDGGTLAPISWRRMQSSMMRTPASPTGCTMRGCRINPSSTG